MKAVSVGGSDYDHLCNKSSPEGAVLKSDGLRQWKGNNNKVYS